MKISKKGRNYENNISERKDLHRGWLGGKLCGRWGQVHCLSLRLIGGIMCMEMPTLKTDL